MTAVLLGVLRALGRLPAAGWDMYAPLLVTLLVEAVSALALGLLASAAVSNASQAALALPMLCFPQVLFAGAVVPVAGMAAPGRLLSLGLANRYSFEALGLSAVAMAAQRGPARRGQRPPQQSLGCCAIAGGKLDLGQPLKRVGLAADHPGAEGQFEQPIGGAQVLA